MAAAISGVARTADEYTLRPLSELLPLFLRFEAATQKTPEWVLAAPASQAAVEKCQKELGFPLPSSLRSLYTWHDGEPAGSTFFDSLLKEEFDVLEQFSSAPLTARFMSLAEVARAGSFEAHVDADGECALGRAKDAPSFHLVPFLWLMAPHDKDIGEPDDGDWLLATDTSTQAVWLFEVAGEGLVFKHAPGVKRWFGPLIERLEKTARSRPPPSIRQAPPRVDPPAILLLRLLIEKKLIELAPDVSVADVAERVTPLLKLVPEKRATKEVVAFLFDDPNIDEVFADEDMLKAITREFVG